MLITYRLLIELFNAGEFQLKLRANELNHTIVLYTGTTVANCKTAASALIAEPGSGFVWTDNTDGSISTDMTASISGFTTVALG